MMLQTGISTVLAQSAERQVAPLYFWSLLLIGLILAAFVVLVIIRRRAIGSTDVRGPGFTLTDLQKMRDEGQIDEAQFQKMRATIISSVGVRK